jgi:hypothetical protein
MKPFPGKHGRADYCGQGAHFYDLNNVCKTCGHEKGKRVKRRPKAP